MKIVAEHGTAPKTPAQALARNRLLTRVPEGFEIVRAIIRGESIPQLERRTGLSCNQLKARMKTFEELAPQAYRRMIDGLYSFLAELAVDDILHWRSIARSARDTQVQKLGLDGYKQAKDTLIKVFGLRSEKWTHPSNGRQSPRTMEEIADQIREDPELAAAVEKLRRLVAAKRAT